MDEIANLNMLFVLSNTKVVNSRFFKRQNVVWRRRQNTDGVVFTTRESVDLDGLIVKKKLTRPKEGYQPGKLFISMHRACDHMEKPEETAWHITVTIEEKLVSQLQKNFEVTTEVITKLALETLKQFDTTAYVKYASYHPELVSSKKLARTL